MKTKKKTRWKIVKDLDYWYSRFIRLSKSKNWRCTCITCNERLFRDKIQNWHFVWRSNYNYRRSYDNCYPQCVKCNIFYNWNYKIYTLKMIDIHWKEKVEEMLNNRQIRIYKTFELEEMIEIYKTKSQELEKNLNN